MAQRRDEGEESQMKDHKPTEAVHAHNPMISNIFLQVWVGAVPGVDKLFQPLVFPCSMDLVFSGAGITLAFWQ